MSRLLLYALPVRLPRERALVAATPDIAGSKLWHAPSQKEFFFKINKAKGENIDAPNLIQ
jgi:hypothetical protein